MLSLSSWLRGCVWFLGAVLLITNFHVPVRAKEIPPYDQLLQLSEQLLQDLGNDDIEQFRQHLTQAEAIITAKQIPLNAEQLDALVSTLVAVKRSLANVALEQIDYHTQMFYLAVDAIGHRNNPQWKNYNVKIKIHLNDLLGAVEKHEAGEIQRMWARAKRDYLLVRPAVLISEGSHNAERMDSLYRFIEGMLDQREPSYKQINEGIVKLNMEWDLLVYGNDRGVWAGTLYTASPIKVAVMIGLIILIIFSFVLWKKFRSSRPITVPWR